MPTELLISIFYLTLPLIGQRDFLVSARISWVCRRWRQIALSSPRMWTYVDLAEPCFSNTPWLAVFLERASGAPMDVCYDVSEPNNAVEHMVEVLGPYA